MDRFLSQVYTTVHQIPKSHVSTYGEIARMAGYPGYARHVGRALSQLPRETTIPWFRVINSQGYISQRGEKFTHQRDCLVADGIDVSPTGKVSLKRYRWCIQ